MARSRPPARGARPAPPPESTASTDAVAPRRLTVGRPVQARLVALALRSGVFTAEPGFSGESRFQHPAMLRAETPLPAEMARLFAEELEGLARLGKPVRACHATTVGVCRVLCVPYFYYDGFKALLYLERAGQFVAAWKEEEVLHPHSPATLLSGVPDAELEETLKALAEA